MAEKKAAADLTATIHLGSARSADPPASRIDVLQTLTAEEQDVIGRLPKSAGMLIVHRGPGRGSRFLLSDGTKIGRDPLSDIFLDDVTISRKHAQVSSENSQFILEDLGSLNGTYLNGASITRAVLSNNDEIQIGKFHMIFFGGN